MKTLRKLAAEALGTMFLLTAVVGSGIMGERLSGGNFALALLANSLSTAAALFALILIFEEISGAHFNPAVTLVAAAKCQISWSRVPGYLAAQFGGAIAGVLCAHAMFAEPLVQASRHARSGGSQILSEFIATFGLLAVIEGCSRFRASSTPFAVAAYIGAAYWFTSSTSFANPAVTLARCFTDTLAGIRAADAPAFMAAQLAGALAASAIFRWLAAGAASKEIACPIDAAS